MKVSQGQSVIDIAIKGCGAVEDAIGVAIANSISVTDDLANGQELAIPDPSNKAVVNYYTNKNVNPATQVNTPEGTTIFDDTFDETFE
jgi:hypothetical protein